MTGGPLWIRLRPAGWPLWVAALGYAGGVAATILAAMLGLSPLLGQLLATLLGVALLSALAILLRRRLGADPLALAPGPKGRLALIVLVAALAAFGLAEIGALFWPELRESSGTFLAALGYGASLERDLALMFLICVAAPLGEEALFRGLLLRGVFDGLGGRWLALGAALALSALAFADAHGGPGQGGAVLAILLLHGVIYGLAYLISGTLWAPVLAHGLNNMVSLAEVIWRDPRAPALLLMPLLLIGLLWLWRAALRALA